MTRYVTGDPVVLTNTFSVSGTPTDPTTVTLAVTGPDGTADTYDYALAEITRSSAGVYTKTITTDEPGTWVYKWTGTGTAADVADGSFHVWSPASVVTTDILSLGEAYDAINIPSATGHDDELRRWITAVSDFIDERCGYVVQRTVTDEAHDGGEPSIEPTHTPVVSVTSVTEYDGTVSQTLTAETNSTKPTYGYFLDRFDPHYCVIWRRSSNADTTFPSGRGNVVVTYEAGRYASTADVAPRFKEAAAAMLRRLYQRESGAWAKGSDPFTPGSSGFFKALEPVLDEYLHDQVRRIDVRAV